MAFYRITFVGQLETGEEYNMTLHASGVTGQAATVNALAIDAITLMWSGTNTPAGNIEADMATGITVDAVITDELDGAGRNTSQVVGSLSLAGTSTDASLPPHVAEAVSLRTLKATRAGRGRFYLPPVVVTDVDAGLLASAAQVRIKNGALAMLQHFKDNSFPIAVYHKGFLTLDTVTAVDVGNVFDVQSRRRNQLDETRVRSNLA